MAVTNYFSIDGEIIGERNSTTEAVAVYVRDNLGSVAATRNTDVADDNRYLYLPYGSQMFKAGSGPSNKFLWAGTWGYRGTGLNYATHYIRARHYDATVGLWTTVDPLWPDQMAFNYVQGRILAALDFTGKRLVHGIGCNAGKDGEGGDIGRFLKACEQLRDCLNDKKCFADLVACANVGSISTWYRKVLGNIVNLCLGSGKICIICGQDNLPEECRKMFCQSSQTLALAPEPLDRKLCVPSVTDPARPADMGPIGQAPVNQDWKVCKLFMQVSGMTWIDSCDSTIILCKGRGRDAITVIHELFHVAGIQPHGDHNDKSGQNDIIYRTQKCLAKVIK